MADPDQNLSLAQPDFDFVRKLVFDKSAIVLEAEKSYLVEARLVPVARREGFPSLAALIAKVRLSSPHDDLVRKVVEAMTTNETSFFRDFHPFEALKKEIIPDLIKARASERKLAIWCAASSSGQEPYSTCMLLRESFPELNSWELTFIASDLSTEILGRAKQGIYSQLEINRGLPAPLLIKYFTKVGAEWQIREDVRKMIDFRIVNLVESWPPMPPLDMVFIRNVLIYFDVETKRRILANIRRRLRPNGVLFLGSAETTLNIDENFQRFQYEKTSYYRMKNA